MIINKQRTAKPTQMPLSKESQDLFLHHIKKLNSFFSMTFSIRERMAEIDRAYQREGNFSAEHVRARTANRYGDKSKLQDMTIPIVQPQVDAMQAYLSGVFLSGNPMFGVVADAANEDAALMYEAIMDENSKHGCWVREFSMFFKDILKYNLGAVETEWKTEVTTQIDQSEVQKAGQPVKQAPVIWEGNKITRIDLYNAVWDTRCAPAKLHEHGEFFGWTEAMSATRLKQFLHDMDGRIAANVSGTLAGSVDFNTMGNADLGGKVYIPQINPDSFVSTATDGTDWFQFAGLTSTDTNELPTINAVSAYYLRVIPQNFKMKVPDRNLPQVWKLVVINNMHIVFAERVVNIHGWLPVVMAQPIEDGLNYQTKSYAKNAEGFQDLSTAIWNASISAQRRAVYDRIFYDPSRIRKEDINSANPIARIPVKSNAYNKPISEAYSHASFSNDQFAVVGQQLQMINSMANSAQGSNPAQQGQFVKGNKTQHEYADVMGHSNDRQQTMALFLESQFFYVVKQILKLNILQFASNGEIFSYEKRANVSIDPFKLRQASVEFEISDGMLPTDRIIASDTFQVLIQTVASSPQMQSEFDLVGMMIYYFKTQGARGIEQFKLTPAQQQQKIAQMQATANAQQPQQPTQPQQPQPGVQ